MPNGKAGDHWYTDVTAEELPTFSPEIDAAIRELDALAAAGREYAPWDDPKRARIEEVVNGVLDEVGYDELASRSETVGMSYRNLTDSELSDLKKRLDALRETF